MLKSHRSLWMSSSMTGAGLCIYHLLVWSNLNFLHISQWITLPTQSCLALYSFCANLLHSLIMWLIIIIIIISCEFFAPIVFCRSFRDSKSPQVSRTLLSILTDLNNAAVWMVSVRRLISKSSNPFTKPLGIVLKASITIGISFTFTFHRFFVL